MATESASDGRCGIGARLRSGRERSGLTLLQAAEKLHVDPKTLEALEVEQFREFGAAVYARGHIRRYAELVGEPAAELQSLYNSSAHSGLPDLTRLPRADRETDLRKFAVPALFVLIGLVLASAVWWVLKRH